MASRRILPALSFLLICLMLPPGEAAGQAPGLGYDHRGQLVEQPRLKVNMFELSDEAAEPTRADLRRMSPWLVEVAQCFIDYGEKTWQRPIGKPTMAAKVSAGSGGEMLEHLVQTNTELSRRLAQTRPPKLLNPDLAHDVRVTARMIQEIVRAVDGMSDALRLVIRNGETGDRAGDAVAAIKQVKAALAYIDVNIRATRQQIETGVGGTPDLWIWRSQIESSEAMRVVFRDMLYALEHRRMPPPGGEARIKEHLASVAEWLHRAKLQVRHELRRARSNTEASAARSRWLEAVYLSYEKSVAAERGTLEWLTAHLPRYYLEIQAMLMLGGNRVNMMHLQQLDAFGIASYRLMAERYRMLAAMP